MRIVIVGRFRVLDTLDKHDGTRNESPTLIFKSVSWLSKLELSASSFRNCSFCFSDTAASLVCASSVSALRSLLGVTPFTGDWSSRLADELSPPGRCAPKMYCFSNLATVALRARSSFFSATIYRKDADSKRSSNCCFSDRTFSSSAIVVFSSASFLASSF